MGKVMERRRLHALWPFLSRELKQVLVSRGDPAAVACALQRPRESDVFDLASAQPPPVEWHAQDGLVDALWVGASMLQRSIVEEGWPVGRQESAWVLFGQLMGQGMPDDEAAQTAEALTS